MNLASLRRPLLVVLILNLLISGANAAPPDALVQDPFRHGYNNWVDTFSGVPQLNGPPGWRYHFENGTLMEPSDGRAGVGTTNAGNYTPYLLIQDAFTTPTNYVMKARFYTSDDDGMGLAFGYQNNNNYFRLSLRNQANGNLGFTRGISVQKIVGGNITQISPAGVGPGNTALPTLDMVDNHLPIDVTLTVNGTAWSVSSPSINGGAPLVSGSDANLAPGKVGLLSWAQSRREEDLARPPWGTEVDYLTVTNPTGTTLFDDQFSGISPVTWRSLQMTNSNGVRLDQMIDKEARGNLGLMFTTGTITDTSNGLAFATTVKPNIDFLGPAIVVNEPNSGSFSNYEMRVRMESDDNDGIGALVRVQNDSTFYRVTFSQQPMLPPDTAGQIQQMPPRGLSVQKSQNGVWTELFRDNQSNPMFVYDQGVPFDLRIRAVSNTLAIEVIKNPDGTPQLIQYPLITDSISPLLFGTVGLTSWAQGIEGRGANWSAFSNETGIPLLVSIAVPEPVGAVLVMLGIAIMATSRQSQRR